MGNSRAYLIAALKRVKRAVTLNDSVYRRCRRAIHPWAFSLNRAWPFSTLAMAVDGRCAERAVTHLVGHRFTHSVYRVRANGPGRGRHVNAVRKGASAAGGNALFVIGVSGVAHVSVGGGTDSRPVGPFGFAGLGRGNRARPGGLVRRGANRRWARLESRAVSAACLAYPCARKRLDTGECAACRVGHQGFSVHAATAMEHSSSRYVLCPAHHCLARSAGDCVGGLAGVAY